MKYILRNLFHWWSLEKVRDAVWGRGSSPLGAIQVVFPQYWVPYGFASLENCKKSLPCMGAAPRHAQKAWRPKNLGGLPSPLKMEPPRCCTTWPALTLCSSSVAWVDAGGLGTCFKNKQIHLRCSKNETAVSKPFLGNLAPTMTQSS